MRLAALLTLTAGFISPAFAQQPVDPEVHKKSAEETLKLAQEVMPKQAIPVPDGPAINKQELEGGLIIEDIKIGDGYEVKPGGAVVALYHGTLKDGGKEFDSAFKRGEPIAFPLSGVIPGWQKGVPGMKIGGIRRLTIPAALGYGAQGAGQDIPPNADLVFIIQLVDALQIEDIKVGDGEDAFGQNVAVTAYVIKDKDGKEIERCDASKPYIWIPGEFQPIQFGLEGMKVGGKRKLIVPKQMNVSPPQANSTRPQNVPCEMEVELIAVRNLQPRRK
jgi:FKBP-type peptidyl-prolyl cis-trans isomerase